MTPGTGTEVGEARPRDGSPSWTLGPEQGGQRRRRATRRVAASAGMSTPAGSGTETDDKPKDASACSNVGPGAPTPNCHLVASNPRSPTSTVPLPLKSPCAQPPGNCQFVASVPRSPTSILPSRFASPYSVCLRRRTQISASLLAVLGRELTMLLRLRSNLARAGGTAP